MPSGWRRTVLFSVLRAKDPFDHIHVRPRRYRSIFNTAANADRNTVRKTLVVIHRRCSSTNAHFGVSAGRYLQAHKAVIYEDTNLYTAVDF